MQTKSSLNENISDLLIQLKNYHGLKYREIAERIGVDHKHLSGVKNNKKPGGKQMLCSLQLLLQLVSLNKEHEARQIDLQIAELKRKKSAMRPIGKVTYPAHQPSHLALNEEKEKPNSQKKLADAASDIEDTDRKNIADKKNKLQ